MDYEKMWNELKEVVDIMNKDKIKEHDNCDPHFEERLQSTLFNESEAYGKVLAKMAAIEEGKPRS
jgi:hypothetical protein